MVLYTPHTLIQFGGRLAASGSETTTYNEIWSCSLRGHQNNFGAVGPVPDPGLFMTNTAAALASWFSATANNISQLATLDYLKINNIDAAGHYTAATNEYNYNPQPRGGIVAAGNTLPMFNTLAVTFKTVAPKGRASRGRISLPFSLQSLGSGASSASLATQTYATEGTKRLLTLFRNGLPGPSGILFVPTVYSSVGAEWSYITSIRTGRRFDTINRRKNAVPETPYVEAIFP